MVDYMTDEIIEANVLIGVDSEPQNINLTWQVVSMKSRSLEIQLNFEKPLYISSQSEPEVLEVKIKDSLQFFSTEGLPLKKINEDDDDDAPVFLRKKIPKQFPSEADE